MNNLIARKKQVILLPLLISMGFFLISWSTKIHQSMTEIAIDCLPAAQHVVFSSYQQELINTYCIIPDLTKDNPASPYRPYVDSFLIAYAHPDLGPRQQQLLFHAGDTKQSNEQIYAYYTGQVLEKLRNKNPEEAMKYLGTFLHLLEDSSCPAHPRYGPLDHPRGEGNTPHMASLQFFKRFMPVPDAYKAVSLHPLIDQGGFTYDQLKDAIQGYQPKQLGTTIPTMLTELALRHEAMMEATDQRLIPMLQAKFEGNDPRFSQLGLEANVLSVKLIADYMYTLFSIYQREE